MRLSKVREKSPHPVRQVILTAKKCPPTYRERGGGRGKSFAVRCFANLQEHGKEVDSSRTASFYKNKNKNLVMA